MLKLCVKNPLDLESLHLESTYYLVIHYKKFALVVVLFYKQPHKQDTFTVCIFSETLGCMKKTSTRGPVVRASDHNSNLLQ